MAGSDPTAYSEGHGTQENLAGRTFGQTIGVDPSVYNLYGADANSRLRDQIDAEHAAAAQKTQAANAALEQYKMEHHGENLANDPKFHELNSAAAAAKQAQDIQQKSYEQNIANAGPTAFDTETKRMLGAADAAGTGKAFQQMAGPYLDALEKSRGEMQGATDLYQAAAEGKGPSAAQSQYQSALDQAARAQMGAAGAMRGGALNQVSAQRDAALNAGQQEAQAASQSAALRAQEMQAAMQGYGQMATHMGQLDQGTAALAARTNAAQQQFYENLRQGAYGQQAQMNMSREQAQRAAEQQQRAWDQAISDATHKRQNEGWQQAMGAIQGGLGAVADVAGGIMTGGATTALGAVGKVAGGLMGGGSKPTSHNAYGGGSWAPDSSGNYTYEE